MKMKRVLIMLLAVVCAFSLASCKNNDNQPSAEDGSNASATSEMEHLSVITGKGGDYMWNDEYETFQAEMSYTAVELESETADIYPALAKALSEENGKKVTERTEIYNDLCDASQVHLDEDGMDYFHTYKANEDVFVRRADSNVLSLLYSYCNYRGGAHEDYAYLTKNYDSKTGKLLSLSEVVTDIGAFADAVKNELDTYWSDVDLYEDFDYKSFFEDEGSATWLLDCSGITVFFNPYEIAGYANGIQIITVPYEGNESFLNAEYIEKPLSFTAEIPMETPFYYDVDNDGDIDDILVYSYETDESGCRNFVVYKNGMDNELCSGAYDYGALFVHKEDGKNYLYVECLYDNDYKEIVVYELTGNDILFKGSIYSYYTRLAYDGPEYYDMKLVMTNPDRFLLDTRTDVLSTIDASGFYIMDKDGVPVRESEWYEFYDDQRFEFTLMQDIEAYVVDEKTKKAADKTITLKKGDTVNYYRTDNLTLVDLLTNDGTVVRVTLDESIWPKTINGVDIEEIFDGMIFAG